MSEDFNNAQIIHLWKGEEFLIRKLGPRARHLLDGPTDHATVRERLRAAILATPSMADTLVGTHRPVPMSQAFARLYKQPLEQRT